MYNTYGKENTNEGEDKGLNIILSGILAVVTSAAVRCIARSLVAHVRCSLYPNTHTLVGMGIATPCICINTWTWNYTFFH